MATEPHPDVRVVLGLIEQAGGLEFDEVSVAEAREFHDSFVASMAGEPVEAVRDVDLPGPDGELPARAYRPGDDGPYPVVVYFHGGGFVLGGLDTHDPVCRALANAAGAVVLSVDYRLAPEHPFPAAVEDAYAATVWAAENAAEVGGDPERVAVAGDSAGGNLAAVVALLARDRDGPALDAQALVYPTVTTEEFPSHEENGEGYFLELDAMEWFDDQYFDHELHAYNRYASPLSARDLGDLPPATVLTAGFDPLRDEGQAYADRLEDAGVAVTRRHYDDMIHGFFNMLSEPADVAAAHDAIDAVAADLDAAFG